MCEEVTNLYDRPMVSKPPVANINSFHSDVRFFARVNFTLQITTHGVT